MKRFLLLQGFVCFFVASFAQVGIGTTTPNSKSLLDLQSTSKGLLLPRMTAAERNAFVPINASTETGMMVYQTDSPKGVYSYNGTAWVYHAPVDVGGANGHTLRWDGLKWTSTSNLFNNGSAVAIGTSFFNYQFQINSSNSPLYTRLQITNTGTGVAYNDGLVLGINASGNNGVAHLIQQENKPLWFGTNGLERVRIDSAGRVGINQANPSATLDVNGSFRLGASGTELNSILRQDVVMDPPSMSSMTEWVGTYAVANVTENGVVYASPATELTNIAVCYARVSAPGQVSIKLMNTGPLADPGAFTMRLAIIQ